MLKLASTKSINRFLAFVVIFALVMVHFMTESQPARAISTPWLHVSGRFIKDPSNNTVILRGVSMVDISLMNSRSPNAAAQIDRATDSANGWYARVVRLPVYPKAIDGQPGWDAGPDAYFNNHLNPAIQKCVAKGIYCIIDWHYIADYQPNDASTRAFWTYVAPKFANTPNVIYELYNEPIYPDDWNTWKSVAQPWVNIVRAAAPNNLLLVGGPRWSQNLSSAASSPFTGSNIVYVAHIYPQHGGQSTWDSWWGNASATVPFFITEWGWQLGGANPTSGTTSGFGSPFLSYLDSKGASWTAWVFDAWWQPVMFDQSWNLLGGDNYMGVFTRDALAARKDSNLPGGGTGSTPVPSNTPTKTNTPQSVPTNTPTKVPTTGPTPTRTNTPAVVPTNTPASSGTTCSPVNATITAPFTFDGAGNLCWKSNSLGSYINNWNNTKVTINGKDITNLYIASSAYPAKASDGYWYISYSSSVAWGHLEVR